MADIRLQNSDGTYTNYTGVSSVTLPKVGGGTETFSSGGGSLTIPLLFYKSYSSGNTPFVVDGNTITGTITVPNATSIFLIKTELSYHSSLGSDYWCQNQSFTISGNSITITAEKPANAGSMTYTFVYPQKVYIGAVYPSSICEMEALNSGFHLIINSNDFSLSMIDYAPLVRKVTFNNPMAVMPSIYEMPSNRIISELITEIAFGSNCTAIGNYGLRGSSATSIELSDTITSIGNYAFRYSTTPTIILGSGTLTIGDSAFNDTKTTSLTCKAVNPPALTSSSITGLPAACAIYVPSASVETYKAAQYWSARASYIQAIPNS